MKQLTPELNETAVAAALTTRWLGRSYYYRPEVGSTNDWLKEQLAIQSLPTGTVMLADYQSQGRGRLERRWEAPPGSSLLMSLLFRPPWSAQYLHWLTMLTSLAVTEAIEQVCQLPVALKWPNDVVIEQNGAWHKVAGLLLEGVLGTDNRFESIIVGVGMNVNTPATILPTAVTPPTSLFIATGQPISRLRLLTTFLSRLETLYETAVRGHSPQPAWNGRLITLGQTVTVTQTTNSQSQSGFAEGTNEWGQLLLRDEQGHLHTITAGDVTLRLSPKQA